MIKLYFTHTVNVNTISEHFIRKVLGEYLSIHGDNLVIYRNQYGKPYLKDYPNIHYNLSHTNGVIVCAVSDQFIGIDIERIRKIKKRIVKRYFTIEEQNYIFATDKGIDERFTKIWTMKEAYVKREGKGIEMPFDSFDTLDQTNIYSTRINDFYMSICSNELRSKNKDSIANIEVEILNNEVNSIVKDNNYYISEVNLSVGR